MKRSLPAGYLRAALIYVLASSGLVATDARAQGYDEPYGQWRGQAQYQAIVRRISEVFPCAPLHPNYAGEVAKRWRYLDGAGEFGLISSVTEAFCGGCTRARLSTDGTLYTCLFAQKGYSLKSLLRSGKADDEISNAIQAIWQHRADNYSELRTAETAKQKKVEMSYIGG